MGNNFLILSILSSTCIFVVFRLLGKYKIPLLFPIIINYLIATVSGVVVNQQSGNAVWAGGSWIWVAVVIGTMFISMFYVIGFGAKKLGVAITSVATKMSVVIPVLFSIIYYQEEISVLKTAGISLAILAVFLISFKKQSNTEIDKRYIYLPVILFAGAGIIDSSLKYAQAEYVTDHLLPIFTTTVFAVASVLGILAAIYNRLPVRHFFKPATLILGILLGLSNLGSIYFFISALNHAKFDSSVVFGINNVGIVVVSVIIAIAAFREKITFINWLGVFIAVLAIGMLSFV